MNTKLYDAAVAMRTLLEGVTEVGGRVYPIVATEGTSYPYIVYHRTDVDVMQTKDGMGIESATFQVDVVTADYTSGLQLADKVLDLMNGDMDFVPGGVTEGYIDDSYIQTITCNLTIE